ncbi:ABC transporter substrate-binding protein [Paenibacillus ehimensis]|uniref:Extracellular solute-binding protein n=1 Tax=Paenibacillus ehimensis TaxID=79264 RepID=A0ABT8VIU2_9BACL|nr:extracellular solute-binding protein [Paenibacillus ehimensis]MDO3680874.1 extracellular solute-binding protein [Paenibacillus ehimensis]MEC0211953.1 extracellular solute-binding protein [Paenibacillus ehimensis]
MKNVLKATAVGVAAISMLSACGSDTGNQGASSDSAAKNGKIELQFLQYKPEARATFDKLIAKFEQQNPNIHIVQDNPPDASTVLKTKVAAGEVPDIVANGGDNVYASLVKAGVLTDFTNAPELKNIPDAYVKMLKDISGSDKVYAIPYGVNADGIIYNKKLFKEMNLTVPKTWDEFTALCKKIQEAGKLPFYFTFKDSWTTLPSFNAFAASTQGDDFYAKHNAGQATYTSSYKVAAEKYLQFLSFGQKDNFGKGYNDGNVAFANGESLMYAQGVWAIAEIKKANPNIELGVFPYPVTNDPNKNMLVSGVDQLLAISAETKHPEEAKKFISFLLDSENAKEYTTGVNTFSAVKGVTQDDASVAELKPYFEKGQVADFVDHYVPSSLKLDQILQDLIMKKDVGAFLQRLDDEWSKAQSRK